MAKGDYCPKILLTHLIGSEPIEVALKSACAVVKTSDKKAILFLDCDLSPTWELSDIAKTTCKDAEIYHQRIMLFTEDAGSIVDRLEQFASDLRTILITGNFGCVILNRISAVWSAAMRYKELKDSANLGNTFNNFSQTKCMFTAIATALREMEVPVIALCATKEEYIQGGVANGSQLMRVSTDNYLDKGGELYFDIWIKRHSNKYYKINGDDLLGQDIVPEKIIGDAGTKWWKHVKDNHDFYFPLATPETILVDAKEVHVEPTVPVKEKEKPGKSTPKTKPVTAEVAPTDSAPIEVPTPSVVLPAHIESNNGERPVAMFGWEYPSKIHSLIPESKWLDRITQKHIGIILETVLSRSPKFNLTEEQLVKALPIIGQHLNMAPDTMAFAYYLYHFTQGAPLDCVSHLVVLASSIPSDKPIEEPDTASNDTPDEPDFES